MHCTEFDELSELLAGLFSDKVIQSVTNKLLGPSPSIDQKDKASILTELWMKNLKNVGNVKLPTAKVSSSLASFEASVQLARSHHILTHPLSPMDDFSECTGGKPEMHMKRPIIQFQNQQSDVDGRNKKRGFNQGSSGGFHYEVKSSTTISARQRSKAVFIGVPARYPQPPDVNTSDIPIESNLAGVVALPSVPEMSVNATATQPPNAGIMSGDTSDGTLHIDDNNNKEDDKEISGTEGEGNNSDNSDEDSDNGDFFGVMNLLTTSGLASHSASFTALNEDIGLHTLDGYDKQDASNTNGDNAAAGTSHSRQVPKFVFRHSNSPQHDVSTDSTDDLSVDLNEVNLSQDEDPCFVIFPPSKIVIGQCFKVVCVVNIRRVGY